MLAVGLVTGEADVGIVDAETRLWCAGRAVGFGNVGVEIEVVMGWGLAWLERRRVREEERERSVAVEG